MKYPCKKPVPKAANGKLCRHCRRRHDSSGGTSTSDGSSGSGNSSTESSTGSSYSGSNTSDSYDSESSTYSSDDSSENNSPRRRAQILSESSESGVNSPLSCCAGTTPSGQKPPEPNLK